MFGRKNKAMRFTSCNKQGVISEAGYRFYSIDRFHFGYQEGDHTAILIVERGIGVTKIYCEDLAWTYPFENEIIPPQKKDEIIKNIQDDTKIITHFVKVFIFPFLPVGGRHRILGRLPTADPVLSAATDADDSVHEEAFHTIHDSELQDERWSRRNKGYCMFFHDCPANPSQREAGRMMKPGRKTDRILPLVNWGSAVIFLLQNTVSARHGNRDPGNVPL